MGQLLFLKYNNNVYIQAALNNMLTCFNNTDNCSHTAQLIFGVKQNGNKMEINLL